MKKLIARLSAYSIARKSASEVNSIVALATGAVG